ncbi:MAG TPA: single-stranded DNA-binding protein [Solirubrobacterales bacterium]|jgi:single-stranded DNA-binding protein|nr:single-stranded DNA-binding protein [Solirubrobacterales bacterium]
MINVEPFKAKLVRDPELRETKRGAVCNMRVRQVDPGKPSVFIDVAVFEEDLAEQCMANLSKGSAVEVGEAGLIYSQWEAQPKRKGGKPQSRSKHSIIAEAVSPLDE